MHLTTVSVLEHVEDVVLCQIIEIFSLIVPNQSIEHDLEVLGVSRLLDLHHDYSYNFEELFADRRNNVLATP